MEIKNVATFLNNAAGQMSGANAILEEDLSNLVDWGRTIEATYGADHGVDIIYGKLADQFNSIKMWSRPYVSVAPSLYMDSDRYGAIRAMYKTNYRQAVEAPMWNLVSGNSYDPNVFKVATVKATFWSDGFSSMVDFDSITHDQLVFNFRDPTELMAFIGMLEMTRNNSHARDWDNATMALLRALIAFCYNSGNRSENPSVQDIKLLTEYKELNPSAASMTAASALKDAEFIRYSIYRMGEIRSQMRLVSKLFSSTGFLTQCPEERQKVVYIDDFSRAAGVYLHDAPNQFNVGNLKLPNADSVPAWQGLGLTANQADRMKVDVDTLFSGQTIRAEVPYVMAVVFDEWACGITAYKHHVSTNYNDLGHFTNTFDQMMGSQFIDADAPAVIFRCV